jgi:hypothetical protein
MIFLNQMVKYKVPVNFFNTIMHEKDDLDRIRDKYMVLVHKKLF